MAEELCALVDGAQDRSNLAFPFMITGIAKKVDDLKEEALRLLSEGDIDGCAEAYCKVLEVDPVCSLKFAREGRFGEVFLSCHEPTRFKNKYLDFECQKTWIEKLAENMEIPIDDRMFGPVSGYKDFINLLKRSWKKKEWSGVFTYGIALATGIIPPYMDYLDFEKDNKIDRLKLRTSGFSVSPLAPLLAFSETAAIIYGVSLASYTLMMHGYYNRTKSGRFRMLAHEYTHLYQVLVTQRMHNDGLCSDLNSFLDTSYNEFEELSLNQFAVREDIANMRLPLVKLVLEHERGN